MQNTSEFKMLLYRNI